MTSYKEKLSNTGTATAWQPRRYDNIERLGTIHLGTSIIIGKNNAYKTP